MMRRTQMRSISAKKLAQLAEQGTIRPASTLLSRKPVTAKRAATGPKQSVRDLVRARSGGMCEWPLCPVEATDIHHRLGRKQGGRHGEARERINGAAWLLHACRPHHTAVTSPFGARRRAAREAGWLLLEHEDAAQVPVWTRHQDWPVLLDNQGGVQHAR